MFAFAQAIKESEITWQRNADRLPTLWVCCYAIGSGQKDTVVFDHLCLRHMLLAASSRLTWATRDPVSKKKKGTGEMAQQWNKYITLEDPSPSLPHWGAQTACNSNCGDPSSLASKGTCTCEHSYTCTCPCKIKMAIKICIWFFQTGFPCLALTILELC